MSGGPGTKKQSTVTSSLKVISGNIGGNVVIVSRNYKSRTTTMSNSRLTLRWLRMLGRRSTTTTTATPARPFSTASSDLTGVVTKGGLSQATPPMLQKEQLTEFMSVFPDVVKDLAHDPVYAAFPEGTVDVHLAKCLEHTVPNGKKNRGLTVPASFRLLAQEEELTEENLRLASILGWCVELLQAYLLIADDIMDGSETRRGQPCWHRTEEGRGLNAFNDAILLEQCVFALLKKYFHDKPYYNDVVDEFRTVGRHTAVGQSLDLLTSMLRTEDGRVDVDSFDMRRYSAIVLHKTSYYSVYLPVALAMRMAGVTRPESYQRARRILLEMGKFFQIQDDYLDIYGDPEVTGKIGTDIQDGKCSWVVVVAMQRANNEQKEVIREHYGRQEPESVSKVKEVFDQLNIAKIYQAHEEEEYNLIVDEINKIPGEGKLLPPQVFMAFLERIYKRDK